MDQRVFVTVGTTSFDKLIRVVDSEECRDVLSSLGYTSLQLQIGRGSYIPQTQSSSSFQVGHFTFAPNLSQHMNGAALVISHAGSGSIFETLRAGKPLVVVINEDLMDNHQLELAEELAKQKFLYCCTPSTLIRTLKEMNLNSLIPYPVSSPEAVVRALDEFLGVAC